MKRKLTENSEKATGKKLRTVFAGFESSAADLGAKTPFEFVLDGDAKAAKVLEAGEHLVRIVSASGRGTKNGAMLVEIDLETFDRVPVACDSLLLQPRADNDSAFAKKRSRENKAVLTAIIKACGLGHHLPGNIAPALAELAGKELLVVVGVETGSSVQNIIKDARPLAPEVTTTPPADESAPDESDQPTADEFIGVKL